MASPLSVTRFPKTSRSAPFFVDLVLKQLRETYPETQLKTEGLRIFTTLDTIMQRSAEEALDNGIANLGEEVQAHPQVGRRRWKASSSPCSRAPAT